MRYIYEAFVNSEDDIDNAKEQGGIINVRFCDECPFFESDGVQLDYPIIKGHCLRLSYTEPEEGEYPYYVRVTANDFCNEDSIKNEVLQ